MHDYSTSGGASAPVIIAVVTIIVLVLMVVVGSYILVGLDNYDSSVWSNKSGWATGLLGVGLAGLATFGVGFMAGKSSGVSSTIKKTALKLV